MMMNELHDLLERHSVRLLNVINTPRYVCVVTPELRADAAAWDVARRYVHEHRRNRALVKPQHCPHCGTYLRRCRCEEEGI